MKCPRFTVRRMMVLVAIVAMLLGAYQLSQRKARFLLLTTFHGARERKFQRDLGKVPDHLVQASQADRDEEARYDRVRNVYHGILRRKYERAACYPWLAVEPDPPEPK